ncbi:hypothetical protein ABZ890_44350 [Streptomyces sp. NPDC046984]|uniref:hypothetical protein n=1 Tax=Streptomyces sp. NPDC046984 TaxID=3155138 RepID=UPI00340EEE63
MIAGDDALQAAGAFHDVPVDVLAHVSGGFGAGEVGDPGWYEEIYERQRKAHSSRRTHVEHGIAHLENWRALARQFGRREHISDTVQAIAGLLSHQQITDLNSARQM